MENVARYETAQICLNGHIITSMLDSSPEKTEKFCAKCGERTIAECQNCKEKIRGYHIVPGVLSLSPYVLPRFCHICGNPYPWTKSKLAAARELADELETLTGKERDLLKSSIDALVKDSADSQVAIMRFKRLAAKAGKGAAEAFKEILICVLSEAAKKSIWP